jgi:hypothetical protein
LAKSHNEEATRSLS